MSWTTVLRKDLVQIARDRAALIFNLIVPVAVVSIVAGSLGPNERARLLIPIVNHDLGPVAEALEESLAKNADVEEMDLARAESLVGSDARVGAALVLPRHLSKNYLGSRPSTIRMLTDPSKRTQLATVKGYLLQADRDAASLADPFSEDLLLLDEKPLTGRRLTVESFEQSVPGFSVMFTLMSVLFGVAFGLAAERDSGAIVRLRVAPLSRAALLAGKLTARFLVGFAQLVLLLVFGHAVFGVSLGPSPAVFVLTCFAIAAAMTGFSLLVSAFARTREQIIPLGLTVVMLVCAMGGCWWPLYMEPPWLQKLALATPTAWAMNGLNELVLRDRGLAAVVPSLAALLAYGAACALLGGRLARIDDRD